MKIIIFFNKYLTLGRLATLQIKTQGMGEGVYKRFIFSLIRFSFVVVSVSTPILT